MLIYKSGDLFDSLDQYEGNICIPHCVNNCSKMGSGFAKACYEKWPKVKTEYMKYDLVLGENQYINVEENIRVVNMCAQHDIFGKNNLKPIRYAALAQCMTEISRLYVHYNEEFTILAPKFGSDRAKGNWSFIEELIREIWSDIDVYIYTLD